MALCSQGSRVFILTRFAAVALAAGMIVTPVVPSVAQTRDWQAEWNKAVAAARAEGELILSVPSGREWRDEIMKFQKAYPEIKVNATPFASRDFWPRLQKEREVGKYLWDLRVGGTDTNSYQLKDQGHMATIRDQFILPEVVDEKSWLGGWDAAFLDKEKKYFPAFCAYESPLGNYNKKFVTAAELPDFKSLLDPKWKGKIVMADPRGGATIVSMGVVYKEFGADFIRDLMTKQEPVIVKDPRQQMDLFLSGRYPIAIGLPNTIAVQYKQRGVQFDIEQIEGLPIWSVGVCGLQMPTNVPHPHATRVFINWILTKDVQASIMKAVELNSRRTDVPHGEPDRALKPEILSRYLGSQTEDVQPYQQKASDLLGSILR
jgi:iron(III) transport system substrate-binding protein